ncbi:MAG TPA: right-handed parallel beta-helix repeat-containing protein [Acidimicrobiales bacterium]|nr:right-handed parallel beta-helix repeat-containing protein [Acidimicrobiales bacterium]
MFIRAHRRPRQAGLGHRPLAVAATALALAAGLSSSTTSAGASEDGPVVTPPPGIANDCSVDVTAKINSWINKTPDGSTLSFTPGACYRIERTVLVKNRHGLTLEGNGAMFRAFTDGTGYVDNLQTRNHFYLWGGGDLTVRNLKIQGVNTDHRYHSEYAGQRGFRIAGVQGALLDNLTIFEVRGDFIEVDPDYYQTWRWSNDVTIQNSTFTYAGRQGFSITGGRHIIFRNNTLSNPALSSFDIEPDSGTSMDAKGYPTFGGASDVHIVNNDVGPGGILFFGNVVRDSVVTKDVEISGNRLHGIPLNVWVVGHESRPYKRYSVTNNVSDTAHGGPRSAVELEYVEGAVVSGNRQPFYFATPSPVVAVRTWSSSDVVVKDNKFGGAKVVLAKDKARFGAAWRGAAGGTHVACGNRYGKPGELDVDEACA